MNLHRFRGKGSRAFRCVVMFLLLSATVSCESARSPGRNTVLRIAAYPLNRVLDVLDCVSFATGVYAPPGELEIHFTRAAQLGYGMLGGIAVGWWPNRELAFGGEVDAGQTTTLFNDSRWAFGPWSWGRTEYWRWGTRGRTHLLVNEQGLNRPTDALYREHRDYWGIGASLKLVLGAEVEFHPVEFADAICGLFFVDFMWDDIGHMQPKPR